MAGSVLSCAFEFADDDAPAFADDRPATDHRIRAAVGVRLQHERAQLG